MAVHCPCVRLGLAAVLVMLLVGLATPRPSPAQEGAEELLKNPGFDQELDGKGLPRDWSVTRDRILWREGVYLSKNYELVSRSDAYALASQAIKLKPGQRYTFRLTLKGEGGALGGALIVHGEEKPSRETPLLCFGHGPPRHEAARRRRLRGVRRRQPAIERPDEDHPGTRRGGGRIGRARRLRPGDQAPARQ